MTFSLPGIIDELLQNVIYGDSKVAQWLRLKLISGSSSKSRLSPHIESSFCAATLFAMHFVLQ